MTHFESLILLLLLFFFIMDNYGNGKQVICNFGVGHVHTLRTQDASRTVEAGGGGGGGERGGGRGGNKFFFVKYLLK